MICPNGFELEVQNKPNNNNLFDMNNKVGTEDDINDGIFLIFFSSIIKKNFLNFFL